MSSFISSRIGSLLFAASLLAGLLCCGRETALAQTQTAELDRIQAPAQALPGPEQRVALVIGNSKYENTTPLANPDNDAQSVAQLLNSAGFDVIAATDLTHNDMIEVMQDFSAKVAEHGPNTVAMIYYAGHGVQVAGENYLIPVDARIASPSDLVSNGVRLVDLMATLESIPSRLRIVMLDSCRNNPFPNLDDSSRGLAIVDAPLRSIVGYSTAPGAEALDGANGHSPYTQAFLHLAREPNLPIEQLFKRIRLEVNHETEGLQTPWESSSATSDFYFFGDTAVASARAPEHGPVVQMASNLPWEAVDQVYDYVVSEDSPQYYQEFLVRFPHDPRCDRIRRLLANLTLAAAWHQAVLANSPLAYKNFYDHHLDSPYAKVALHLQSQPRTMPLLQADHLLKGSGGFQHQLPLSSNAKITTMPVHTGLNTAPTLGKIVNLPSHDKGSEHNFRHEDRTVGHNTQVLKAQKPSVPSHDSKNSFVHDDHIVGHNDRVFKPQKTIVPQRQLDRREVSNTNVLRSNRFANTQAHMTGGGGGGGTHLMMGGGGGGFRRRF
ncbi:MAG TPA: caspase family protein [Bradyrhizobium sp.]|uniref:caspase family protein n=1 Tax=Bradyrhizobium sp. TaxID=376 RepID=UPI002D025319|nr:caspase family protein [Bradyrhizobium sp.]HLZ00670.1 caspase family protein [Bradyrhizobium sp.]